MLDPSKAAVLPKMVELAQAIEAAGATIINTGIGWHEARILTIATPMPRGAFSWVTRKLKGHVSLPLVGPSHRINDPQVADDILSRGDADMVSMARPFLADAELPSKRTGRADEINTCIGCNQPVSIRSFVGKSPRAW